VSRPASKKSGGRAPREGKGAREVSAKVEQKPKGAVRVFKDCEFDDWAKNEDVADEKLCEAAAEVEKGLINARLGGFLIKKRVGAPGRGKRGAFRTIIAHRQGDRLIFLHGFCKNEQDNISRKEKEALHKLGDQYMEYSGDELSELVNKGLIIEIRCKVKVKVS
jgi:hypothetical protein